MNQFFALLLSGILTATSLSTSAQQNKVIPPSPTAAALGKYGDIPVSLYTGIPNITIPLYEIKAGSLNLPISLSYHASGVRVEEEASWVGLNWSLMAGGVITRSIRGFDDLNEANWGRSGYLDAPVLPSSDENNEYDGNPFNDTFTFQNICNGTIDAEPDVFYFNFAGRSGKFVFEKKTTAYSPITVSLASQEKINISIANDPGTSNYKWTIITEDGTHYIFRTAEKTRSSSSSAVGIDVSEDPEGEPETITSSWYLDDIITPDGESIHLSYSAPSVNGSRRMLSKSEERTHSMGYEILAPGSGSCLDCGPFSHIYSRSLSIVYDVYLEAINFRNGKITFVRDDRSDIKPFTVPYEPVTLPKKLKEVIISTNIDGLNTVIKSFELEHTYFNNNSSSYAEKRLKLLSLKEKNGSTIKPAYIFDYVGPTDPSSAELPPKDSKGRDHWGFYNGKVQNAYVTDMFSYNNVVSTLIPPHPNYYFNGTYVYLNGANREADEAYMKYGLLKKITYPTGGSTEFDFESNDYSNIPPEFVTTPQIKAIEKAGELVQNPDVQQPETVSITISQPTVIKVAAYVHYDQEYDCSNELPTYLYAASIVSTGSTPNFANEVLVTTSCFGSQGTSVFTLPPGTYEIIATSEGHLYSRVTVTWDETSTEARHSKLGGGVRIKQIKDHDGLSTANDVIKDYGYTHTDNGVEKSSGKLMSPLSYAYLADKSMGSGTCGEIILCHLLKRTSDSNIPLGSSAQGNPVGYSQVTVLSSDNGKTVYNYENSPDILPGIFVPGLPNNPSPGNGSLLRAVDFKKSGNTYHKVKEVVKTYATDPLMTKTIKGMKVYGCSDNGPVVSNIKFYDNRSEWRYPETEVTTIYDPNDETKFTETVTTFLYENPAHYQLTETATTHSDGSRFITQYKYPADYTTINTGIIGAMKGDHHVHNAVIEKVVKKEKDSEVKVIGSTFTTYSDIDEDVTNGVDYIVPVAISELEITAPKSGFSSSIGTGTAIDPDYRLQRNMKYDSYNNLVEIKDHNKRITCYLWSYLGEYPVAEIRNASYATVEGILGASTVEAFNQSYPDKAAVDAFLAPLYTSLPANTQITKYVYAPLVGMTSMTDPKGYTTYYEYDSLKRVQSIRDDKRNIVKSYDYHYKP